MFLFLSFIRHWAISPIVFFTENRIPLISRNLTQRLNVIKFKQIVCTSEKTKLEKLCRFIRKINRSDIL